MAARWRMRWYHLVLAIGLLVVLFGAHPSSRDRSRQYIDSISTHWGWKKPQQGDSDAPSHDPTEGLTVDTFRPEPSFVEPSPVESSSVEPELVETTQVETAPTESASAEPEKPGVDPHQKVFYQADINYTLPEFDVQSLKHKKPHHYKGPGHPTYATWYATRNATDQDPYFIAVQQVVYRTLWNQKSRSQEHPMVVYVAPFVAQEQRDYFAAAGAIVRELPLLPFISNDGWLVDRLQDVKTKLLLWNETDFSRIIFLDSDAFPWETPDLILNDDLAPVQTCRWDLLEEQDKERVSPYSEECEYVFSAVYETDDRPNAGVMVLKPNEVLFDMVMRIADNQSAYDNGFPEQGPLSILYHPDGPFPGHKITTYAWNGGPDQILDGHEVHIIHSKIWALYWGDVAFIQQEFNDTWQEMLKFYESPKFAQLRDEDNAAGRI